MYTNFKSTSLFMIGVWFRKGKVFLSLTSTLIPQILINCYATLISRHFRFHKTLVCIKQDFSWPNMHRTVEEFLQQYENRQCFKTNCMKPTGLLQPLPVPNQVWTDIFMDFIEGLPSSHGYSCIMVVVDRLSKYAHLIPLKHPYTAIIVAKAFISNIFDYMAFLPLLLVIATRYLSAPFGKHYSSSKAPSYI